MPGILQNDAFPAEIARLAKASVVVFDEIPHRAVSALSASCNVRVASLPSRAERILGCVDGNDVVKEVDIIPVGLDIHTKIAAAEADKVTALTDHIFDVGGIAVGEGKLFAGKHPAVEIPSAPLVVRVHKSDVAEIAVEAGCFTRTESIVCAALTVPTRFVVEPTEKAVRIRADVKTEGPDASARTDSVGITDARKGAVGVPDLEIGLYLPGVLHIVKTSARKHSDMPHVRVSAHCPKLAVGVAVHRRSAVLINAEAVEKRRFGAFGYA